jgi:hypothetical protein
MSMVTPNSSILPLTAVTYLIECPSNNWAPKSELLSNLHAAAEEPNNVGRLPTRNLCLWLYHQKGKHLSHNKWMFCLNDVIEVWVRRKWFRSCCHSYYLFTGILDTDGMAHFCRKIGNQIFLQKCLLYCCYVHVCVSVSVWYVILLAFKKKVGRTDRHTFAEKLEIKFFCRSVSGTVVTCMCVYVWVPGMSFYWLSKKRWEGQTGTLSQKNWKSNFSAEVSLVLLLRVCVCMCECLVCRTNSLVSYLLTVYLSMTISSSIILFIIINI